MRLLSHERCWYRESSFVFERIPMNFVIDTASILRCFGRRVRSRRLRVHLKPEPAADSGPIKQVTLQLVFETNACTRGAFDKT
ncbi:MAG: hypothetical protein GXP29_12030 [Planctomycetes bacterium]|nr:hypothetical protein [Planctomycetota bacterium]